jgi:hypothetical protein
LFPFLAAVASAFTQAAAKAQAVYDRDCPARCSGKKSGMVAYRLRSIREVTISAFEDPAIPPGLKKPGYQVVVGWRLLVRCERAEIPAIEPTPAVTRWDDLEQILIILLKATPDNLEIKLKEES